MICRMSFSHRKKGFSLLELSIVMLIVSLLAALLITVLGAAREKGRQTQCASNLRQIGTALQIYRTDYDGSEAIKGTPSTCSQLGLPDDSATQRQDQWVAFVTEYVKDPGVLRCPNSVQQSLATMGTNYGKFSCEPTDGVPPYRYTMPGQTASRGSQTLLLADQAHNVLEESEQPRWASKKVIVYRLDGSLQTRQVPRDMSSDEW